MPDTIWAMCWGSVLRGWQAISFDARLRRVSLYGLRSSSILAALFNAVFLLVATGAIAVEAVQRFFPSRSGGGQTRHRGGRHRHRDQCDDRIVVRARAQARPQYPRRVSAHDGGLRRCLWAWCWPGFAILATGLDWIDPLVSLVISGVIVAGTWSLLRDSMKMTLHGVPPGVDERQRAPLPRSLPRRLRPARPAHLADEHDGNGADLSPYHSCGHPGDAELRQITDQLRDRFSIPHATLQIETDERDCALHGHAH